MSQRSAREARQNRVTRVASTTVGEDAASIAFRICRIDEAHREVWGYAVSAEVGWDNKVLPHAANVAAFSRWMGSEFGGNVREMHHEEAVGRVFHWEADDETERILVGVRISDGAESTWKKVTDGVLRAFSVNGKATPGKARTVMFVGKNGVTRSVRQFDEWDMGELSLVDVPGDRGVGSFTSIVRSMNGDEVTRALEASEAAAADLAALQEAEHMGDATTTLEPTTLTIPAGMTGAQVIELVTRALEARYAAPVAVSITEPTIDHVLATTTASDLENAPESPASGATAEGTPADAQTPPAGEEAAANAGGDNTPAGEAIGSANVAESEGATRDITSALAEAQAAGVTSDDERTDAELALAAVAIIDTLVAREALEQAASGESETWDIEILNEARTWLRYFAEGEMAEANAMVTRSREGAPMNETERAEIADLVERLRAVEAANEEGVQRAATQEQEAAQERADLVRRVAELEAQPAGGGPLRTVPEDIATPQDAERVLRRLRDEMPSSASEIDNLIAMNGIREAQRHPVTEFKA